MAIQIQFRRGTASEWTSANTLLAIGELGLETDTGKFKVGTGLTGWNNLPYSSGPIGPTGAVGATGPIGPTGATGAKGATGQGFDWNGTWNSGFIYSLYDVVEYNGSSYVVYDDFDFPVGVAPPDNLSNWQLVAQRGATGAVGATGAIGATGSGGGTSDGGACMAFGVTGVWFRPPYGIGNQSLSTSGTQHLPIWIEKSTTFDRIAVRTVTVTTAGTMYLGIYNDSTTNPGRPGTLKLNAGAVGYTANNTMYAITINETLNRGWYWLSSYLTGGSSTWRGHGAYVENFWYPRIFGTPDQGSPYDAICPTLFGGTTFGDNPTTSYSGYAANTIFLRTKV